MEIVNQKKKNLKLMEQKGTPNSQNNLETEEQQS
jgi:hypothetical protein